jgi:transposase
MAEAERVTVHTVKLWISVVKNKGALALMRNTKPYVARHARNLDAKALCELAAKEPDRKVAMRLRAIADVAGGLGFLDVGARLRISGSTVANWLDQFNEGGLEALRSKRVR